MKYKTEKKLCYFDWKNLRFVLKSLDAEKAVVSINRVAHLSG